jgi:glutamate racemase
MVNNPSAPIGIFDSGIGGLTVAHAITKILPNESLIYFGDTEHLPYGDKSEAAIQAYSVKIADILLRRGCKVIVIACNSASSAAYELLKEYVNNHALIINVIDPMVDYVSARFEGKNIGLIGTKRTVHSGIYLRKIEECNKNIKLNSLATPLLAPMIEEGYFNNKISQELIDEYLKNDLLKNLDALILACTHYPLIKKEIDTFYSNRIDVLDSSEIVALALKLLLTKHKLLSHESLPHHSFLVSDYTESFEAATNIFFGSALKLEKHTLWS